MRVTNPFDFSTIKGINVFPHRCGEWMVRAAPSTMGQVFLVRIITGKQGELSNP
jgi:hypothetical protein